MGKFILKKNQTMVPSFPIGRLNKLENQSSGYVPYTGATQDLNLGHFYLESDGIKAHDSAGGFIKSNNGTTIAQYGAGGGANWTFADGVNYTSATADTLAYFNGSKTLSSVTVDGGLSFSGGILSVDQSYSFTWIADHLWRSTNIRIEGSDVDLSNGLILYNNEANNRPFLKLTDRTQEFYVGFKAPDDFSANNPQILWSLPDTDSAGVWKSDGLGTLSISPVSLTSDVSGILPYANGGTNSSTSFTAGSIIFAGASGFTQHNAMFFFDDANERQGIGTNTPSYGLHVSKSDLIPAYFNGSGTSTRIGINNGSNTGFGLYIANALKWSIASVNGGGGGTNPDLVFYNDQTSTNTLWLDGNNNNVSIGVVAPSTTNKFHVESTYTTSASRIAYFKGTSGTSGLEVRTNGQAQMMLRSSTHTDRELRYQMYSDGHAYISAQGLSGSITSNLNFFISADSGSNSGTINFSLFYSSAVNNKIKVAQAGVGIGGGGAGVTATSYLTLGAGTATAGTAPLKFTSGTLNTTAEAGAVEFLTDKWYGTITTGASRKEFTLNDIALTSGRIPFTTTDGRITDSTNLTWDGSKVLALGYGVGAYNVNAFSGSGYTAQSSNPAFYEMIRVSTASASTVGVFRAGNSSNSSLCGVAFKSGTNNTSGSITFQTSKSGSAVADGLILDEDLNVTISNGKLTLATAGNGIFIKEGTNATMGVVTLVAGTATVSTTKVTANSRIFLTRQTASGTLGSSVDVTARTAGTSFTITSNGSVLDTSDVAWLIVEPS